MSTGKLLGKPNKLRGNDLRWTSIPSRGSRKPLHATKTGDKLRRYEPVGSKASFFFRRNRYSHKGSQIIVSSTN